MVTDTLTWLLVMRMDVLHGCVIQEKFPMVCRNLNFPFTFSRKQMKEKLVRCRHHMLMIGMEVDWTVLMEEILRVMLCIMKIWVDTHVSGLLGNIWKQMKRESGCW